MQIKSGELTGAALDWAVADAEYKTNPPTKGWVLEYHRTGQKTWPYSTVWDWGGPIIEREQIEIRKSNDRWVAMWWADNSGMAKNPAQRFEFNYMTHGPTPLVAAMRAYVASKMGDTVDVPDDLV